MPYDNAPRRRFAVRDRTGDREDIVRFTASQRHGNTVVVPHVEIDPRRRGEGLADQLMDGLLDQIEAASRFIVPSVRLLLSTPSIEPKEITF